MRLRQALLATVSPGAASARAFRPCLYSAGRGAPLPDHGPRPARPLLGRHADRRRSHAAARRLRPFATIVLKHGSPDTKATFQASTPKAGGQIAARLWEVRDARQRLIARGLYRLRANQRGSIRFDLHPNAYRVGAGRRFKLELLGRDAPYAQASKRAFSVRVQRLRLVLPTAKRGTQGVSR